MIDPALLEILCCPETHQPLALAAPELIAKLNREIAAGQVRNRAGQAVSGPLDGGLLRQDGKWLYPIRSTLPILLVDEAIPVESASVGIS